MSRGNTKKLKDLLEKLCDDGQGQPRVEEEKIDDRDENGFENIESEVVDEYDGIQERGINYMP